MRAPRADSPVRVLYVIGSMRLGGSERHLYHLVTRLNRTRFTPMVCCLFETGPLFALAEKQGIRCVCLHMRRSPNPFLTVWRVARGIVQLIRLMRRERVAILDAYLYLAYVVAIPCGWLAGIPIRIAQRRNLHTSNPNVPLRRLLGRFVNSLTTQIVANSRAVERDSREAEGLPDGRILVIPNGVEIPAAPRAKGTRPPGLPPGGPIILCVANLIHYKGHLDLLAAAAEVLPAFPDTTVVIVGEGDMRSALEAAVIRHGLEGRVRLLGQRMDVPALLPVADLFVLPSHEEGFSNALLEAMAAGLPVIATAVGGNLDAIEDGVSGVLVPPRDPAALAKAMTALLEGPTTACRMGQRARSRVADRFGIDRMVRDTEELYRTLLGGRPFAADVAGGP